MNRNTRAIINAACSSSGAVHLLCLTIVLALQGCSQDSSEREPIANDKEARTESGTGATLIESEAGPPNTASSGAGSASNEDLSSGVPTVRENGVRTIYEVLRDEQNSRLGPSGSATEVEEKVVTVSGRIGRIDRYYYNSSDADYNVRIGLESGLPITEDFGSGYEEFLLPCDFRKLSDANSLVIGQEVVVTGDLIRSPLELGLQDYSIGNCRLVEAIPAVGPDAHVISETEIAAYGENGEKLRAVHQALEDANVDYFDFDESDLRVGIEISGLLVDDDGHFPKAALTAINAVPVIEYLNLGVITPITNQAAVDLAKVKYCEQLEIHAELLESDGLASLLSVPGICELTIHSPTLLDSKSLAAFERAPQLRVLSIAGDEGGVLFDGTCSEACSHLANLRELRDVTLVGFDLADEDLMFLQQLPHLRGLELNDCSFHGSGLNQLVHPEKLWTLVCIGPNITDEISVGLKGMDQLLYLNLTTTSITDKFGDCFTSLGNIKEIYLDETSVSNKIGLCMRDLPHVESISLSGTRIDDEFQLPIADMQALSSLDLSHTQVAGNVCERLGASQSLRHLILDETPVDDSALKRLASSAKQAVLESLELRGTKVTSAGLLDLLQVSTLQYVVVDRELEIPDDIRTRIQNEASFNVQQY
ncbi:MAG: hypothetical protein R3C18_09195 [Planctomycetaceae bacterium]